MPKTVTEIDNMIETLLRERETVRKRQKEIARKLHALRVMKARTSTPGPDAYDDLMEELSTLGRTTS
jgi:hypothetical protein